MQNKHQFFFLVLGVPTLGEGGGSTWLGQIPKFFQKFDLKASLLRHKVRNLTLIFHPQKVNNLIQPNGMSERDGTRQAKYSLHQNSS